MWAAFCGYCFVPLTTELCFYSICLDKMRLFDAVDFSCEEQMSITNAVSQGFHSSHWYESINAFFFFLTEETRVDVSFSWRAKGGNTQTNLFFFPNMSSKIRSAGHSGFKKKKKEEKYSAAPFCVCNAWNTSMSVNFIDILQHFPTGHKTRKHIAFLLTELPLVSQHFLQV